ncbi:hypothetical protein MVEG_09132 [Podila verticillata NRRL 6337]|nr:hypothetical protein MVEG_09132 [Podila verticillata NRRL 6337]
MDLLNIQNHFQDSARRAAGTFLTPLTNAISEQKRLIESLAVVSKVRVEECKHMMLWSKSQTEDIGDVLLKLNLLIRKISDYEIRFGTQYGDFREKIKYLRTKDDTLCEMGQRQNELQMRVLEASKSKLRSAKAKIWQSELDDIQKNDGASATKLQELKRELIKGAYTEQLNAIVEFGKKLQIIGEHGLQLLEHIDVPGAANDGRETEDILQSARINLENWDKLVMVNPQAVVVHSPSGVSLEGTSSDLSSTITVTLAAPEDNIAPGMPLEAAATTAVCNVDPKDSSAPPLPPREPSSDSFEQDLVDNRKSRKSKEPVVSEEERLRLLEELEIKQALELSKASATTPRDDSSSIDDLKLTPEELRFVMDGVEPTSTGKATGSIKEAHSRESSTSDQSIVAPKVTAAPRIVRNPQVTEVESNKVSQQGPRPWIPEEETANSATKEITKDTPATPAPEELASASSVIETMGETPLKTAKKTSRTSKKIPESMGSEPERPLESMGSEPAVPLESMGSEGHEEAIPAFVPMPRVPSMDGIRTQKIMMNQQLQQVQKQSGPSASPELQYLEVQNSPLVLNSNLQGQTSHLASPSLTPGHKITTNAYQTSTTYQPTTSYQPSTKYVPQPKQKNRLSGTPQLHQQQQYQMQHQLYQQQQQQQFQQQPYQNNGTYSAQYYQQQHQQLQDFYYTPYEQQSNPSSFGWNVPGGDDTYKEESYSQYGDTSPSPSHISLIPDNSASPLMTPSDKTRHDSAYKVELR